VLGVRPEHIRFSDAAEVRGSVFGAEYLGTTQIVTVDTGYGRLAARLPSSTPVRIGETVGLVFRSERLSLFDAQSGAAIRTASHEGAGHG
jgi:multiple sugar transport system ATP-binding protein